jgi:hypothetical protein
MKNDNINVTLNNHRDVYSHHDYNDTISSNDSIDTDLSNESNDTNDTDDTNSSNDTNDTNDTNSSNDTNDTNDTDDTNSSNDTNGTTDTNDTNSFEKKNNGNDGKHKTLKIKNNHEILICDTIAGKTSKLKVYIFDVINRCDLEKNNYEIHLMDYNVDTLKLFISECCCKADIQNNDIAQKISKIIEHKYNEDAQHISVYTSIYKNIKKYFSLECVEKLSNYTKMTENDILDDINHIARDTEICLSLMKKCPIDSMKYAYYKDLLYVNPHKLFNFPSKKAYEEYLNLVDTIIKEREKEKMSDILEQCNGIFD